MSVYPPPRLSVASADSSIPFALAAHPPAPGLPVPCDAVDDDCCLSHADPTSGDSGAGAECPQAPRPVSATPPAQGLAQEAALSQRQMAFDTSMQPQTAQLPTHPPGPDKHADHTGPSVDAGAQQQSKEPLSCVTSHTAAADTLYPGPNVDIWRASAPASASMPSPPPPPPSVAKAETASIADLEWAQVNSAREHPHPTETREGDTKPSVETTDYLYSAIPPFKLPSGAKLQPGGHESPKAFYERLLTHASPPEVLVSLARYDDAFYIDCLRAGMERFECTADPLDMAMRKFFLYVPLPTEAQQIDRMLESFAIRYAQSNPDIFTNPGACRSLSARALLALLADPGRCE